MDDAAPTAGPESPPPHSASPTMLPNISQSGGTDPVASTLCVEELLQMDDQRDVLSLVSRGEAQQMDHISTEPCVLPVLSIPKCSWSASQASCVTGAPALVDSRASSVGAAPHSANQPETSVVAANAENVDIHAGLSHASGDASEVPDQASLDASQAVLTAVVSEQMVQSCCSGPSVARSPLKRSAAPQKARPRHFHRGSTTSRNFFCKGDDRPSRFGTGTVGLLTRSATTAPPLAPRDHPTSSVTTTSAPPCHSALHMRWAGFAATAGGGANRTYPAPSNAPAAASSVRGVLSLTQGADPCEVWQRKEKGFAEWRSDKLSRSLYYRLRPPDFLTAATSQAVGSRTCSKTLQATHGGSMSSSVASLERRRLQTIAKERERCKSARTEKQLEAERTLLDRRRRGLAGEPVDLPDAYYVSTLESLASLGGAGTSAPPAFDTITSGDHRRACCIRRKQLFLKREELAEERHKQARKVRMECRKDMEAIRLAETAYRQVLMEGRPRVVRAVSEARAESTRRQRADEAAFQRAAKAAMKDTVPQRKHDQGATSCKRHGLAGAGALAGATQSNESCAVGNADGLPDAVDAAAGTRPGTGGVLRGAPAIFQSTTTHLLSEMKHWYTCFESPARPLPCGSDPVFRREWLQQLEEDRQRMNERAAAVGREQKTLWVQNARDEVYQRNVLLADQERVQKSDLTRRLESLKGEARRHAAVIHDTHQGQRERVRQTQRDREGDRRRAAEEQRITEKENERVMHRIAADEHRSLQEAVAMSRRCA